MRSVINTWPRRLKALGLFQKDLADAAGGFEGQLSDIINGKVDPRISTVDTYEAKLKELENDKNTTPLEE